MFIVIEKPYQFASPLSIQTDEDGNDLLFDTAIDADSWAEENMLNDYQVVEITE